MAPRVVLRPPDLGVDEAVDGLVGEGQLARGWRWGIQAPLWSMHEVALRPMSVFRRGVSCCGIQLLWRRGRHRCADSLWW